ncbi:hypothetical protein KRR38_33185 [Novosphingobium sp. G106]|uniref:hypothetical protein n=1 Tax=Novosphingobium sp. G106 TaxID=2849500 RepID=UPI001C2D5379|nr:hypothetical protein [Novosphingobium sp. G106]MBV1692375.1 hypothetical protein [Novosphingobium sp. G106]
MIVRVFVPRSLDSSDGSLFSGSDHNFPVLPKVGDVLCFTDGSQGGDYTVSKAGFIRDGEAFIAAVWLEGPATEPAEPAQKTVDRDRGEYRDLNYDVPPESMTGY